MKERPILFSGQMVRAILDGRKTQTRRLVKPQPNDIADQYASVALVECLRFWQDGKDHHCPYGQPGDRLWVKETFYKGDGYSYRADEEMPKSARKLGCKWKPSIFMPRSASRITLEVVSVRVERLQDISATDALAEGCSDSGMMDRGVDIVSDYARLWESINGDGSWAKNPWIWVIEFKRL